MQNYDFQKNKNCGKIIETGGNNTLFVCHGKISKPICERVKMYLFAVMMVVVLPGTLAVCLRAKLLKKGGIPHYLCATVKYRNIYVRV